MYHHIPERSCKYIVQRLKYLPDGWSCWKIYVEMEYAGLTVPDHSSLGGRGGVLVSEMFCGVHFKSTSSGGGNEQIINAQYNRNF